MPSFPVSPGSLGIARSAGDCRDEWRGLWSGLRYALIPPSGRIFDKATVWNGVNSGLGRVSTVGAYTECTGTNDYYSTQHRSPLGAAPRTHLCVIRWSGGAVPNRRYWFGYGTGTSGEAWRARWETTSGAPRLEVVGGFKTFDGRADIDDGEWHLVAFVFDGANVTDVRCFVDTEFASSTSSTALAVNTTLGSTLRVLGDPNQASSAAVDTDMALFAEWDRALSEPELRRLGRDPWGPFRRSPLRVAAGGGTVSLSGSATVSVTASGDLSQTVNLSGSATISVTAAGDLTQTLGFSGSATISVGGSGSIGGTIALSGEAAIVSMNGVGKLRLVLYEFRAEGLNTRGMAWGHRNLREGGVNRRDMLPWKFYNSGTKEGGTYYVMTDGSIVEKADNSLPDSGTVYTSAELGRDAVFPGGRATQVDGFEKVSLEAGGFSSSIGEVVNQ